MSHVLVKPTSGPEVGEVGDPVAGACVGQDLPRPARQRLGLSPDSAQTHAPVRHRGDSDPAAGRCGSSRRG